MKSLEFQDDLDLKARGYRREMPRRSSTFSLVALSFSLTCTWSGTGSSIGISLQDASAAGTIWSLPVAALMTAILSAGVAELASAYPVAGAQYYWTFCLASKEWRAFASDINGWLSILGWWLASGAACNFIASLILPIVILWYPDYEIHNWQQWLVYIGIVWLAVALNTWGSQLLPLYNRFNFLVACITLTATTITLFVCSRNNHAAPKWTFGDVTNGTGWQSEGFAFLLAISNAVYAFLGTDCGAHVCEEIHDPTRNTPKIILYPILMGLVTAFPFAVACMNAITNMDAVLNSPSGVPLIEIYYQSTGSKGASSIPLALFAFCFFGCTIPLNGLCLTGTVVSITSYTASSSLAHQPPSLQWSVPRSSSFKLHVPYHRRCGRHIMPERPFSLGRFGLAINLISVLWVILLDILCFFPTERPVTKENINYVSVVSVGLTVTVFALYLFSKRGRYLGPRVPNEDLRQVVYQMDEGQEPDTSNDAQYSGEYMPKKE
ncbi:uncharacterized protein N7483_006104 [Penicillium malachiteum]|uniref:uncharacterized protein n=1 Tax=Penicillium malachiteum TaxID=1324776 RepID=UPI0025478E7D|nr:uncharacterized protein N7483_006104 [Penicillium malachiteum]KAJ5731596.1 hypothetical protein N7483_006104 [Penicillium malachiteum]